MAEVPKKKRDGIVDQVCQDVLAVFETKVYKQNKQKDQQAIRPPQKSWRRGGGGLVARQKFHDAAAVRRTAWRLALPRVLELARRTPHGD